MKIYYLPGHGGSISNGLGQALSGRGYDVFGRETVGDFRRLDFNDQVDIKKVLETFTHYLNKDEHKLKEDIKERNDSFLIENLTFDYLGNPKLIQFKKIWRSPRLDQEDKKIIWKWIDSFVYLSDKYAKNKTNQDPLMSSSTS